jgi:hypothetical protein
MVEKFVSRETIGYKGETEDNKKPLKVSFSERLPT